MVKRTGYEADSFPGYSSVARRMAASVQPRPPPALGSGLVGRTSGPGGPQTWLGPHSALPSQVRVIDVRSAAGVLVSQ